MNDQTAELQKRIEELEKALEPFAIAADGFEDPDFDADLEYKETDDMYYPLWLNNDKPNRALTVQHLLEAERIMWKRVPKTTS